MSVELLACPFCGSSATAMRDDPHWWVECDKCGLHTPTENFTQHTMDVDPDELWNTRTSVNGGEVKPEALFCGKPFAQPFGLSEPICCTLPKDHKGGHGTVVVSPNEKYATQKTQTPKELALAIAGELSEAGYFRFDDRYDDADYREVVVKTAAEIISERLTSVKPEKESGEMQKTAPSLSESSVSKDSSEDADYPPFSPNATIDLLRNVLTMLEAVTDPSGNIINRALLPKARVYLRAIIGRGIAGQTNPITQPDDDLKIQNVESQVSVSALPESGSGSESSGSPLPPPRAESQNKDQKLG